MMRTYPHCDTRVLHAPGECGYCDQYADDLQTIRVEQRIAFSGHEPKDGEVSCPADQARGFDQHQRWPGNTPEGYADQIPPTPDMYPECIIDFKRGWRCTIGYHTVHPCALVPKWWNLPSRWRYRQYR